MRLIMDYKEMYLKMMRASEAAIRILVKAQQECEEMYLDAAEPAPGENWKADRITYLLFN